jgi:hypothetical protein
MTNFAKGDVVTVRGAIAWSVEPGEEMAGVKIGNNTPIFIPFSDLTLVHHHFDIGDRVYSVELDGLGFGVVRAVSGEFAWVEGEGDGGYWTLELSELRRPEAAPAAIAEAAE